LTRDSGAHWTELTDRLPQMKWIARIETSRFDSGTVYVAQNGKREDDFRPYIYRSTDYGSTWESIADGIPSGPVNVVREDPKNPNVLYVGTDIGAYVSLDGGSTWNTLADGLPSTFVSDMKIHPRDDILVASTHGRGLFALDVRNLQKMTPEVLAEDLHVFEPESVVAQGGFRRVFGTASFAYYLKDAGGVSVEIRDEDGRRIQTVEGTSDAGYNTATWDLSVESDEPGASAGPGRYTVVVTQNGRSDEQEFEVRTRSGNNGPFSPRETEGLEIE